MEKVLFACAYAALVPIRCLRDSTNMHYKSCTHPLPMQSIAPFDAKVYAKY